MIRRILVACCCVPFLLFADTYTVLCYHSANPPYSYIENDQMKGIFPDIFEKISLITGHQFSFVNFSVARGLKLFDQGMVDIEPGVHPSWRKHAKTPGSYTLFYATSREVVISKEVMTMTQPRELYGKVLGAVRGYRYGEFEQHFSKDKIVKVDSRSEVELLAQLNHGHIDYAIMGEATAMYYRSTNKKIEANPVMLVSELPVSMRLQPHLVQLKGELNDAL